MKTKLGIGAALGATLTVAAASPGLAADDVRCTGTIGAVEVKNVVVPEDATCTLEGTRVLGDVSVLEDAELFARDIDVRGSVQAQKADGVRLVQSSVRSIVKAQEGGPVTVRRTQIGADLQVSKLTGAVTLDRNLVGNGLQAQENRGGVSITGNRIRTNLFCQDNEPAPVGGGNVVGGDAQGQCEDLAS